MSFKILVVEDEAKIRRLVADYLKNDGYEVIEACDGEEGLACFYSTKELDLVILDVMMPKMNGWEVCEEIRMSSEIPILFLTALSDTDDEIQGLELGADDYIAKPFSYSVFIARVRNLLKRQLKNKKTQYVLHEFVLDTDLRSLYKNQILVELSPKEYDLLLYFFKNANQVLERQQILDQVWGLDYYGDPRTIDTHVKNLRNKLDPYGDTIKTQRGLGYKFEVIL